MGDAVKMKKKTKRRKVVILRPNTVLSRWQEMTPKERMRLLERGKLTADDLAALKALGLDAEQDG